MIDSTPTIDDHRRASALMALRASDAASVIAFLKDPDLEPRATQLLRAVDAEYRLAMAELRTDDAIVLINELVDATIECGADIHLRRAAEVIAAMRDEDTDRFNAVVRAVAADSTGSRLIADVADCYAALLPELGTATARDAIAKRTVDIAARLNRDTEAPGQ